MRRSCPVCSVVVASAVVVWLVGGASLANSVATQFSSLTRGAMSLATRVRMAKVPKTAYTVRLMTVCNMLISSLALIGFSMCLSASSLSSCSRCSSIWFLSAVYRLFIVPRGVSSDEGDGSLRSENVTGSLANVTGCGVVMLRR